MTHISFYRWLTHELRNEWDKILEDICETNLVAKNDKVLWKLESKGICSVKSTYNALTCSEGGLNHSYIWKGKISAKIIFLWLVANNVILTKDNKVKRQWKGDPYVVLVIPLNLWLICCLRVQLQNLFRLQ